MMAEIVIHGTIHLLARLHIAMWVTSTMEQMKGGGRDYPQCVAEDRIQVVS